MHDVDVSSLVIARELLERDDALAALRAAVPDAANGRGQLVLVAGEAGVGKTALLRRFCEEQSPRSRVLWGACDALFTPRPLGPIVDIAQSALGELAAVAHGSASRPYHVAAALFRELHDGPSAVLVVEDVHWADEATLDVLTLVASRIETVPALLIASYRDEMLGSTHPLRIVLGELTRGRPIQRLQLSAVLRKLQVATRGRPPQKPHVSG